MNYRFKSIQLNLNKIQTKDELHNLLCISFDFPSWYGRNWDAFSDLMWNGDHVPRTLIIVGMQIFKKNLPHEANMFQQILEDLKNYGKAFSLIYKE